MTPSADGSLRGRLLLGGKLVTGTIGWERGRISRLDVEGEIGGNDLPIVAPGLVDLHVHGFGGADPLEDLSGMARSLARAGTTAFQPTLFPATPKRLGEQCADLWKRRSLSGSTGEAHGSHSGPTGEARRSLSGPTGEARASFVGPKGEASGSFAGPTGEARVVGIHLEGPFVNPDAAGALPKADLCAPSAEALREILGPATGDGRGIRTMTLAPELAGASELVVELAKCGVRVSLGHSLASAADARSAARAGASGATHLFNAMAPWHHREAGLAGFALTDGALFAEIIGDLVHVGPEAFELALRAKRPAGLCLVSDALAGAGTGCDRFRSHGREHVVRDGAAYYAADENGAEGNAPRLAGSASSQLEMIRRLVLRGVVALPEALALASSSPATALGLEREIGVLGIGLAADLIVLRGRGLELESVFVGGVAVG